MDRTPELAVTLSPELFARLTTEAAACGVPLAWVVAALIADTLADARPVASRR